MNRSTVLSGLAFLPLVGLLWLAYAPPQIVQGHDPVACARTDGFAKDGTPIHACTCKRMGHGDGEECEPDHEPQDCKAYCKGDLCTCPIECATPEAPK